MLSQFINENPKINYLFSTLLLGELHILEKHRDAALIFAKVIKNFQKV